MYIYTSSKRKLGIITHNYRITNRYPNFFGLLSFSIWASKVSWGLSEKNPAIKYSEHAWHTALNKWQLFLHSFFQGLRPTLSLSAELCVSYLPFPDTRFFQKCTSQQTFYIWTFRDLRKKVEAKASLPAAKKVA